MGSSAAFYFISFFQLQGSAYTKEHSEDVKSRQTPLCVCAYDARYFTRKVRKLVHTKRIEELICAVAGPCDIEN